MDNQNENKHSLSENKSDRNSRFAEQRINRKTNGLKPNFVRHGQAQKQYSSQGGYRGNTNQGSTNRFNGAQNQQTGNSSQEGSGFEQKPGEFGYRRPTPNGHSSQNRSRSQGGYQGGGQGGYRNVFQNRSPRKMRTMTVHNPQMFVNKAKEVQTQVVEQIHQSFNDFDLPQILKDNIAKKGYTVPTPIQDQAIKPIIEGHDLIGIANTGTGKTAAFLLPIINKIFKDRTRKALIIAPTRELATQIHDEFRSFTRDIKIFSCLIIGGANMGRQVYEMRRNPQVVVATPGRLKDLIQQKAVFLEDYDVVVLDEVDLMVDIGFIEDVKYFISKMPQERQSLFFSATITTKIAQVLDQFVKDPVSVSVKTQETAENIEQDIVKVRSQADKIEQLHDLLIKEEFKKVLIFGRTKHGVDKLHRDLEVRGFKLGAIHGNKSQGQRQRVLDSFKRNEIQILLATDVAARGLDIPLVTHVINYELPESFADYTHRIGRTGRANNRGTALTFID